MVAGCVKDVELVDLAADRVKLAVEVLDSGRVGVLEAAREEARHDGRLAHLRRAEDDHAVAILGGYAQLRVARTHLLDHRSQFHRDKGRGGGHGAERSSESSGAAREWPGGSAPTPVGSRTVAGLGISFGRRFRSHTNSLALALSAQWPPLYTACVAAPPRALPASMRHTPRAPRLCFPRPLQAATISCRLLLPRRSKETQVQGRAGARSARTLRFSIAQGSTPQGHRSLRRDSNPL